MPASLFIERHVHGLAFYINGDLQFDTADEALYHEYLVVPAIALAVRRFPETPLRVLVCGGGDGLAVRDALRFPEVAEVTLVDYNPEVLELGRTTFKPYNQGSLLNEDATHLGAGRVTVHTAEALEFLARLPHACYHVVICDFTFPTSPTDTRIYSREWFQQVQRVLQPAGVMSTNGVSPTQRTLGFWCLYQTLFAADLHPKPLQVNIPSFERHGYGDWGFFLAATTPITRSELATMTLLDGLQALSVPSWLTAFQLPVAIANLRHNVHIHTLDCSQLFYYLLNPQLETEANPAITTTKSPIASQTVIDFLDLQEIGTGTMGDADQLQLETMAKLWLDQLNQSPNMDQNNSDQHATKLNALIPVQHRYHSPRMTREWLGYVRSLLTEIDLNQLINSLLERAQELPPQLVRELKQLGEKIRSGQPLTYISEHTTELITILSVTLIMANLTAPDSVFAKGFYGGSSRRYGGSSSSSSCYYDANGVYQCGSGGNFGWLGFWTMMIGGVWLFNLYRDRDE